MDNEAFLIYVPINTLENAKELAKKMVEERLCACANIYPRIFSVYHWEGKIVEDNEAVVLFKTLKEKREALYKRIAEEHPYSVPAIISLPTDKINSEYLEWMKQELKK